MIIRKDMPRELTELLFKYGSLDKDGKEGSDGSEGSEGGEGKVLSDLDIRQGGLGGTLSL
jgi:hypothetical protein